MHVHSYLGLPCNFTTVSPDYCPRQSSNISNLDFTFIKILDLVIRQEIVYCLQSFIIQGVPTVRSVKLLNLLKPNNKRFAL